MKQSLTNKIYDHEEQFAELFGKINELIYGGKLVEAARLLVDLHHADLADFLDNSSHKIYKQIIPVLAPKFKADTLVFLSDSNQQLVIEALGLEKAAELLEQLDIEDVIEVIENVDEFTKHKIISYLSSEKQTQIIEGFTYPEDTVGRIIERDYISFKENWKVGDAIDYIRKGNIGRDFHAALVVDNKARPVGNILLSSLLKNDRDVPIKQIMSTTINAVEPLTELSEIAFIFKQYALTIVPVINKSGKIIGSISIDNMIYIIEEQTEKDIMQLGGISTQDTFYDVFSTAKHRFPWLFMNLITAFLTSLIISRFNDTIAKLISLAAVMPIVASMGGNAGTQAMTVTIRALANKDINTANMVKVVCKEIMVCCLNGLILASIGVFICMLIVNNLKLSYMFGIAVVINFLIAGFLGTVIPITLYNQDIDPATASGVFVTALTDALGFCTFLTLAYVFLV